jgi:hypothetical protein
VNEYRVTIVYLPFHSDSGWVYRAEKAPEVGDEIEVSSELQTTFAPVDRKQVRVTAVDSDGSITAKGLPRRILA